MTRLHEKHLFRPVNGFLVAISITFAANSSAFAEDPLSSLFTTVQADRGAVAFAGNCAACHGDNLQGGSGPALVGSSFSQLAAAQNLSVKSLLDRVTTTMPMSAPASLKPNEYEDLVAFLLRANGYVAGSTPLNRDNVALSQAKFGQAALGVAGAVVRLASSGVYTVAQASHGKALFTDNCALCHGGSLRGIESAPALVGTSFTAHWGGGAVGALHAFIDNNMPPGNGGSLGVVSEADIVAYILSQNQYPAGPDPLPSEPAALNAIVMK